MMNLCKKCSKLSGAVVLLVGIGFLLKDLGWWTFWGLEAWTVVLLLLGLFALGSCCCEECQACCGGCCEVPPTASAKKKQ